MLTIPRLCLAHTRRAAALPKVCASRLHSSVARLHAHHRVPSVAGGQLWSRPTAVSSSRGQCGSSVPDYCVLGGARCKSDLSSPDGQLIQTDRKLRNIAVIAHVDHGKTTLVDQLLRLGGEENIGERAMDWNDLEMERGITILSKSTSFKWKDTRLNIVDTPGHADFGGEVERILSMVDGVMLVVDAREGPMAQTKFVLGKALAKGLHPMVVFNKIDREGSRLGEVEDEVFDLFASLEATDEQLDFPMVYASAKEGWATLDPDTDVTEDGTKPAGADMSCLLDTIVEHVPPPQVLGGPDEPFRMLVTQIERDTFVGKLALGRVAAGRVKVGDPIKALDREGNELEMGKVTKLMARRGLGPVVIDSAEAGDIVQLAGLDSPRPTNSMVAPSVTQPMFADPIDPPTVSMLFGVNDSPLVGRDGNQLTSTMIANRLEREAETNVAINLKSAPAVEGMCDAIEVQGRGEMQLAVLIETMRREGFELSVSPPRVLFRKEGDELLEPWELVVIDVDEEFSGLVMEKLQTRKAQLQDFTELAGKSRLSFLAPSRALIGFQSQFKSDTRGTGVLNRAFDHYGPFTGNVEEHRKGALIANGPGRTTAYALAALEPRGRLFVGAGVDVYEGMIVGEHTRTNDLEVNPVKGKKLTNMRASGTDEAVRLAPPVLFPLEEVITYVGSDELVEVTPKVIRMRKAILNGSERKIQNRAKKNQGKK